MPPDGENFTIAPGAEPSFRWFHIVDVPDRVAVVGFDARRPTTGDERAAIRGALAKHVDQVAFLVEDRKGAAVVQGWGMRAVLATATAALKVIGGWDESVPVMIDIDDDRFAVRLTFDGARWVATVDPPAL